MMSEVTTTASVEFPSFHAPIAEKSATTRKRHRHYKRDRSKHSTSSSASASRGGTNSGPTLQTAKGTPTKEKKPARTIYSHPHHRSRQHHRQSSRSGSSSSSRPQRIVHITFYEEPAEELPEEDGVRKLVEEEFDDEFTMAALPDDDVRIPTDRLGRVKRGIDVRDFRPLAPRNTTQDLMVRQNLKSSLTSIDFKDDDDDLQEKKENQEEINLDAIQEFGSMVPFHRLIRRRLCCGSCSDDDLFGDDEDEEEEEDEEEGEEEIEEGEESEGGEEREEGMMEGEWNEEELDLNIEVTTRVTTSSSLQSSIDKTIEELEADPKLRTLPYEHRLTYSSEGEMLNTPEKKKKKKKKEGGKEGKGDKRKKKKQRKTSHWSDELSMATDATSSLLLEWISEQEDTIARLSKENRRLRKELSVFKDITPSATPSTSSSNINNNSTSAPSSEETSTLTSLQSTLEVPASS